MAKPGPILWFDFQVILSGYMVPLTHTNLKKMEKSNTTHYFRKCNLNNCVQFGFAFSSKVFIRQKGCSSSAVTIVFLQCFFNSLFYPTIHTNYSTSFAQTTLIPSNLNTVWIFLFSKPLSL
jgi:hypothetical protein